MYNEKDELAINEWLNFVSEMIIEHVDEMAKLLNEKEAAKAKNSTDADNTGAKVA